MGTAKTIYTDASHATHRDGKGHVEMIVTHGSRCIEAKSSKIRMVTLSPTKSEGAALCDGLDLGWMGERHAEGTGI